MRSTTLLLGAASTVAATTLNYKLIDEYTPDNFFDKFNFITYSGGANDGTGGFADYKSKTYATGAANLAYKSPDGKSVIFGADSTSVIANGENGLGRPSVRLEGISQYNKGIWVADIAHMPGGACGSWPAYWSYGNTWPTDGEIDILEGVNFGSQDKVSLHTGGGTCTINDQGNADSGTVATSNCDYSTGNGCGIDATTTKTFGDGFNSANGGYYVTQWTDTYIKAWFFPRGSEPDTIHCDVPDATVLNTYTPVAYFAGNCDFSTRFVQQHLVFTTNFCGSWAGQDAVYTAEITAGRCPNYSDLSTGGDKCRRFVADNPSAFANQYWQVNGIKIYGETTQTQSGVCHASSSSSSSIASSTSSRASSSSSVVRSSSTLSSVVSSSSAVPPPASSSAPASSRPSVAPSSSAPASSHPVVSSSSAPVVPPSSSAPVVPPSSSAPHASPSSSAPVVPPSSSAPVVPPSSSAPVVPPSSSAPVVPPSSSAPVVPPSSSAPHASPSSSAPVVPPSSSAPVVPPSSSAPHASPSSSAPVVPPSSSAPVVSPTASSAPHVSPSSSAPVVSPPASSAPHVSPSPPPPASSGSPSSHGSGPAPSSSSVYGGGSYGNGGYGGGYGAQPIITSSSKASGGYGGYNNGYGKEPATTTTPSGTGYHYPGPGDYSYPTNQPVWDNAIPSGCTIIKVPFTTKYTTTLVDVCPTGLTTKTVTTEVPYCARCKDKPTSPYNGFTETVKVCTKGCAVTAVSVTVTVQDENWGHPSGGYSAAMATATAAKTSSAAWYSKPTSGAESEAKPVYGGTTAPWAAGSTAKANGAAGSWSSPVATSKTYQPVMATANSASSVFASAFVVGAAAVAAVLML